MVWKGRKFVGLSSSVSRGKILSYGDLGRHRVTSGSVSSNISVRREGSGREVETGEVSLLLFLGQRKFCVSQARRVYEKVLFILGTRPEAIKLAPVIKKSVRNATLSLVSALLADIKRCCCLFGSFLTLNPIMISRS